MAGGARAWTPEEKLQLLLRIMKANDTQLKISWKDVELPEGRTQKACMHAIEAIKKEAGFDSNSTPKKSAATKDVTPDDGEESTSKATAKKTPTKKRAKAEIKKEENGEEMEEPPKKKRKTQAKKATKNEVKVEDSGIDDNITPEKPVSDEADGSNEGGFSQFKDEEG